MFLFIPCLAQRCPFFNPQSDFDFSKLACVFLRSLNFSFRNEDFAWFPPVDGVATAADIVDHNSPTKLD